jgi:hypothetical protein
VTGLVTASLLWAGMTLGVSFLAAPVKFRTPTLTRPVALDVGRHVFRVFNRVELGWGVLVVVAIAAARPRPLVWVPSLTAVLILGAQTAWLRPRLNRRVATILAGLPTARDRLHVAYVALEAVKVAALVFAAGTCLLTTEGRA